MPGTQPGARTIKTGTQPQLDGEVLFCFSLSLYGLFAEDAWFRQAHRIEHAVKFSLR